MDRKRKVLQTRVYVCVCVCMRERQKRGTVIYSPQQEHPVTDTKPEDLLSVPESPQLKKDYEAIPATLQKERYLIPLALTMASVSICTRAHTNRHIVSESILCNIYFILEY